MTARQRRRHALLQTSLAAAALVLVAFVGQTGCGGDDADAVSTAGGGAGSAGKAGKAGASAKAGAAAAGAGKAGASAGGAAAGSGGVVSQDGVDILEPQPKDYSCGPGCRPVFSVSYRTGAVSEATTNRFGTIDTSYDRLYFSAGGESDPTFTVGHGDADATSFYDPALTEHRVMALMLAWPILSDPQEQIVLYIWDRQTGQILHKYPMPVYPEAAFPPGEEEVPQYGGAAANETYALYSRSGGLFRVTLADGTVKLLGQAFCFNGQLIDDEYLCADENKGQFQSVNIETGATKVLAPSKALQIEGSCSLQGDQCAWVDYRDPPGTTSNVFTRFGGDIYLFERGTATLRRVTFDSPDTPKHKIHVAVEGDLVTWLERGKPSTAPTEAGQVIFDRVVRLDLTKGTRCWLGADRP